MTTDLWMLLWTGLWTLALPYAYIFPRLRVGGLRWGVGNRDDLPETDEWVHRAERAHRNMVESLGPFAVIILVAHISGAHNELTAAASMVFFGCRIVHAALYIVGIAWWRSIAFYTGMAAELLIVSQVLRFIR